MLDPQAPPRSPAIAAALGRVRVHLPAASSDRRVRRLLVACSGGPDSMAALGLLVLLRRSESLELVVGHVDHGLRSESASEAAMVADVAAQLGLESLSTRVELERGPGLPARAREARREALAVQRRECDADFIVLAHTATDQAETMLMHLVRGAGLDGLAAMPTLDRPWLRPVLELTRAETRSLCSALELSFVDDPTNADIEATRIWLRESVLPRMRDDNPQLEHALLGLARQADDAERALNTWAERELDQRAGEPGTWHLDHFDTLPRAVRSRTLRRACERLGVDLAQLRRRVIEAMDEAACGVAIAARAGPGTPNPAPRGWDLHPQRRVIIDKRGLRSHFGAAQGGDPNH